MTNRQKVISHFVCGAVSLTVDLLSSKWHHQLQIPRANISTNVELVTTFGSWVSRKCTTDIYVDSEDCTQPIITATPYIRQLGPTNPAKQKLEASFQSCQMSDWVNGQHRRYGCLLSVTAVRIQRKKSSSGKPITHRGRTQRRRSAVWGWAGSYQAADTLTHSYTGHSLRRYGRPWPPAERGVFIHNLAGICSCNATTVAPHIRQKSAILWSKIKKSLWTHGTTRIARLLLPMTPR